MYHSNDETWEDEHSSKYHHHDGSNPLEYNPSVGPDGYRSEDGKEDNGLLGVKYHSESEEEEKDNKDVKGSELDEALDEDKKYDSGVEENNEETGKKSVASESLFGGQPAELENITSGPQENFKKDITLKEITKSVDEIITGMHSKKKVEVINLDEK